MNKIIQNDDTEERALLGSIFLDSSSINIAYDKGLKPDFFTDERNKNIFKVMQEMNAGFIPIDSISFLTYAKNNGKLDKCGGIPYIQELEDEVPTSATIEFYIDQVICLYKKKLIQEIRGKLFVNIDNLQNGTITLAQMQEEIQKASDQLKDLNNNIFAQTKEDYLKGSAFHCVFNLLQKVETKNFDKVIPTGFKDLDLALEGGLTPKLYVIGAISSIGKTTLMLQMADQLAESGCGVMFFSMEMNENELASKTFSRLSYKNDKATAVSATQICTGKGLGFNEEENLRKCVGDYEKYAKNFHYEIGIKNPIEIRRCINTYIHIMGKRPVVFIDYLQLIEPVDTRLVDKQAIDANMTALKTISNEFNIPVITISSVNRESYNTEISMSSFKESGKIEYSADIAFGLQPCGMSNVKDANLEIISLNETKGSKGEEYPIEFKILKQRFGSKPKIILFYRPRFDVFRDATETETRESLIKSQEIEIELMKSKGEDTPPDNSKEKTITYRRNK